MARPRSPNRDKAMQLWIESGKNRPLKDIAAELEVSEEQVRKWKNQDKWNKVTLPNMNSNVTNQKGGQPGNKNAVGHGAPVKNDNAVKHGLFEKYLPQETLDIVNNMVLNPLDILWDQIQIAYAAIVRAQHIMYVTGKTEMIKELKKSKIKKYTKSTEKTDSESSEEEFEYEFQFAWDRHATFMNAQARAQGELRSLIKQYDEMLHKNWNMATEEQKQRIKLMKAQADKISGSDNKDELQKLDEVLSEIKGVI